VNTIPATLASAAERLASARAEAQRPKPAVALHAAGSDETPVGALELLYQPRLDTRSLDIVCVEALLRWNQPGGHTLMPSEFVPLAERNGLIIGLGKWVVNEAVWQVSRWLDQGWRMRVAINASVIQFESGVFAQQLRSALERHRVPGHFIEVELTESAPIRDGAALALTMAELSRLGVSLALDDFGREAAGLGTLGLIPAAVLKFDKVLIDRIDFDPRSRRLVAALVVLAHSMGAISVAEGVERRSQLSALRAMNCDQVQGFLFSRPVAARAVPGFFLAADQMDTSFRVDV
jgi:EAL domain-containing protein (putative c-di-GMP-specific phosphodiesterase class I)